MSDGWMRIVRWMRGALGTAATWAAIWSLFGAVLGLLFALWVVGIEPSLLEIVLVLTFVGALMGAKCGLLFAIILSSAERGRPIEELSSRRVTLWGALAGATFPMLSSVSQPMIDGAALSGIELTAVATSSAVGAISAVGSLAMAKRSQSSAAREPAPGAMHEPV